MTPAGGDTASVFDKLAFRHTWRPYQQRVLDNVGRFLDDRRLHIVAAPGAGKTSLGLELFRRIGRPTVVFSPTRTVRNQWIGRLEDFDRAASFASWSSTDLGDLRILTSVTYQALHSRSADSSTDEPLDEPDEASTEAPSRREIDRIASEFAAYRIGLVILDEAHHLRAEWWRSLSRLFAELEDVIVVSLTATPPYGVSHAEWDRYTELCGPIDDEISIPELVKSGTLCPHQDYIWVVPVTDSERARIQSYDDRVSLLCSELEQSEAFGGVVWNHPWLGNEPDARTLLDDPDLAIAILAFLKARAFVIPSTIMELLDLEYDQIPALDRHQWQVLLHGALYSRTFDRSPDDEAAIAKLRRRMKSLDLLRRREICIERSRRVERSLAQCAGKIDAAVEIHLAELDVRGAALRQVILVDYIRDEQNRSTHSDDFSALGAWPVYRELVARSPTRTSCALLTGRLSVIHVSIVDRVFGAIGAARCTIEPFEPLADCFRISGPLAQIADALTTLLAEGHITALVGTRALLGEGWDCPAVNSIVLASSVGAYITTNQMRGRALRRDARQAQKASSIWHLVAVDPLSESGISDARDVAKRFETFVGLSEVRDTIESGIERLGQPAASLRYRNRPIVSNLEFQRVRARSDLSGINTLAARWQAALTLQTGGFVAPSVRTEPPTYVRRLQVRNTLRHLARQGVVGLIAAGSFAIAASGLSELRFLGGAAAGYFLFKLSATVKVLHTMVLHAPTTGSIRQIGRALMVALYAYRHIETDTTSLSIQAQTLPDGKVTVCLVGGTFHESSVFADCMATILGPIDRPRYLVTRAGRGPGRRWSDYHAVPERLAVKKESASSFLEAWRAYVGPGELIYTRSEQGRATLLHARARAFSSTFTDSVERQDRWAANGRRD